MANPPSSGPKIPPQSALPPGMGSLPPKGDVAAMPPGFEPSEGISGVSAGTPDPVEFDSSPDRFDRHGANSENSKKGRRGVRRSGKSTKRSRGRGKESKTGKWFGRYLILVGVLAHLAIPVVGWYLYQTKAISFAKVEATLEKASFKAREMMVSVEGSVESVPVKPLAQMDGRIRTSRPRILDLGPTWPVGKPNPLVASRFKEQVEQKLWTTDSCKVAGSYHALTCWLITGSKESEQVLLDTLSNYEIRYPKVAGNYGNAHGLALIYDILYHHPRVDSAMRFSIEKRLEEVLVEYLKLLDGASASLWHGRTSLATRAWIIAVALDPNTDHRKQLQLRALSHFLESVKAAQLTQAWPEGYNYWINSRAFLFALASSAYLNGIEGGQYGADIQAALKGLAYWPIYAIRPDGRVEALGDEGPRMDLQEESRKFIDFAGLLTRDPAIASFSRYLDKRFGKRGYYKGYRWLLPILMDAKIKPVQGVDSGSLLGMENGLSRARLFGRNSLGLGFIRQGWGANDTFISFRAGHTFTHHANYDAGHFTLFKGTPLVVNSATYTNGYNAHRLYYGVRSIARNTVLVMRPGEDIRPTILFKENIIDGGQRLVMPTGSAVRSVADWQENVGKGMHVEGGKITQWSGDDEHYSYADMDLTAAYDSEAFDSQDDGGKVRKVRRQLLYLFDEDRLIVRDEVVSTKPEYTKKWLLHTIHRPQSQGAETVLKGAKNNGIIETASDRIQVTNGEASMNVVRILPKHGKFRILGGPDYRYYVETDADDSTLDGRSFGVDLKQRKFFDAADWRLELMPGEAREEDVFLVALSPKENGKRAWQVKPIKDLQGNVNGLSTGRSSILFALTPNGGRASFSLTSNHDRLVMTGLDKDQLLHINEKAVVADEAGVVIVPRTLIGNETNRMQLRW